jgi:hypothetical protein
MSLTLRRTGLGVVIDGIEVDQTAEDSASAAQSAAATAEGHAQSAITAAGTASTAAATASTAAATAASAAATASTAAATAQTTANGAVSVNTTQDGSIAAAASAASAASAAAAAALAVAGPFFVDEYWKARWREISPTPAVFRVWDLALSGAAQNNDDSQWDMRNGASRSNGYPMSVLCNGAGQNVAKLYSRAMLEPRNASWYFAGAGYWIDATIDGTGDIRAFRLDTSDQTKFLSAGVHTGETGHFSFALAGGGAGPILMPSTVVYAPGFHTVEMRYNHGTGVVQGSVDGESWVTVTASSGDIPSGGNLLMQDHGCFEGTGQIAVTLAALGTPL